jgi:hypothetical protein
MDQEPPMKFEAHQHLQMAQLIRRKAARLGNPPHMLRKANLFLALAKTAAKQAQGPRSAPATRPRQSARTGNTNHAILRRGTKSLLDPRKLVGPLG